MWQYRAELALNLLINTIATVHFQSDQCIAYYKPYLHPSIDRLSPLSQSFPVVLNDFQCKHGCRQYIVENPFIFVSTNFTLFRTCMVRQRNTDMKVIVVLHNMNINIYSILNGDVGIHVIIIIKYPEFFHIYGFANLEQTEFVLLNRWNILEPQFYNDPDSVSVEAFFDDRWKQYPNARINLDVSADNLFMYLEKSEMGHILYAVDIYMVFLFTKYLNIQFKYNFAREDVIAAGGEKKAFFLAHRSSSQVYFPQTYPTAIFSNVYAIPKPKYI